jgi:hypothetical protein
MKDWNYIHGALWDGVIFPLPPWPPQFRLLPFFPLSLHFHHALAPFLLNLGLSIF